MIVRRTNNSHIYMTTLTAILLLAALLCSHVLLSVDETHKGIVGDSKIDRFSNCRAVTQDTGSKLPRAKPAS